MVSVKEIIIVEGTYDKIKLSSFIDSVIFVTGGFSIMKDQERINGLAKMVDKCGGVILTDSDSAGFRIRNFLKQKLPPDKIKHAYIPDVSGKEKRKRHSGAEGLMGVEGMDEEVIIKALISAGCCVENETKHKTDSSVSKAFLYELGLSGGKDSKNLRCEVLKALGLPSKLSANMMCDVLESIITKEELTVLVDKIKKDLVNN